LPSLTAHQGYITALKVLPVTMQLLAQ